MRQWFGGILRGLSYRVLEAAVPLPVTLTPNNCRGIHNREKMALPSSTVLYQYCLRTWSKRAYDLRLYIRTINASKPHARTGASLESGVHSVEDSLAENPFALRFNAPRKMKHGKGATYPSCSHFWEIFQLTMVVGGDEPSIAPRGWSFANIAFVDYTNAIFYIAYILSLLTIWFICLRLYGNINFSAR